MCAVDCDSRAIHEACLLRADKGDDRGNLLDGAEPSERHLRGLVTTENETITTPLALLAPNWHEIAHAIHERSGRQPIIPSRYMATKQHEAHIEPS